MLCTMIDSFDFTALIGQTEQTNDVLVPRVKRGKKRERSDGMCKVIMSHKSAVKFIRDTNRSRW